MPDDKLTALADATAIADTDIVAMVKDMGTTPATVSRAWSLLKSTLKTYFDTLYLALVAPGTSGNVLTSNGTIWTSAASGGGPATQITETGDPATLDIGAVASGQVLVRSAATVIGRTIAVPAAFVTGHAGLLTVAAGATVYLGFNSYVPAATELDTASTSPFNANCGFMRVRTRTAQPGTGSLVFTFRPSAADGTNVITVAAGAAAAISVDNTHTDAIGGGQLMSIKVTNNASAASAQIAAYGIQLLLT